MTHRQKFLSLFIFILPQLSFSTFAAHAQTNADKKLETIERGREVYQRSCAVCHGKGGDGKGFGLILSSIRPRDLTQGVFKYRSTPEGQLPTDQDLYHTITQGIFRTGMPHHGLMSETNRKAVVAYIKSFYPQWETTPPSEPLIFPPPPKYVGSPASIARGKEVYQFLNCARCHGPSAKGDGPVAANLPRDVSGNVQSPADFTKGGFKSGHMPADIYRTIAAGLNGSAMTSFGRLFADPDGTYIRQGDGWHLVHYLFSLQQTKELTNRTALSNKTQSFRPIEGLVPKNPSRSESGSK